MKNFYRQTWWLITSLLLFLPWLAPAASAEVYGNPDHDCTIEITPHITDNSITLNYAINPTGVTATGYRVEAEMVPLPQGVTNPEFSAAQSGALRFENLAKDTSYSIYLRVWIYTTDGDRVIFRQVADALSLKTTGGTVDPEPTVTYKAVLGAATIGARTITIPYQFFMVKDGQDIAITNDNKGDLQFKAFFAWAENDTEQETKALTGFNGAYVCEGLNPATAYDLWPKFFVNGKTVYPHDQNFTLTTLEETVAPEPENVYTVYVQEYSADGQQKIGDAIALEWTAPYYAFKGEIDHYYAIVAKPTDGGDTLIFGAQPNTSNNVLKANVEPTNLSNPGWSFKFETEGTLYIYTEGEAQNAKPKAYKFDAIGGGQTTTTDLSFEIIEATQTGASGDQATFFVKYKYTAPSDKTVLALNLGVVANNISETVDRIDQWHFANGTVDPAPMVGTYKFEHPVTGEGQFTITLTGLAAVTQDAWVKAKVDFGNGDELDIDVKTKNIWSVAISPNSGGSVITKPGGAQSLEQLGAVNTFSGKVVAATLNADGTDLDYLFPSYSTGKDVANGMSGHYTKSVVVGRDNPEYDKYHWTPDLFYTIGNDAEGHIVGVVNYPTPLGYGFVPQIKINNNLWIQFESNDNGLVYLDADGKEVAKGTEGAKEYRQYYFSTAYKQDFVTPLTPWFDPVTYVNDATVSFFFRSPMYAGGEHQTRTYTYKTANSTRTTEKTVEDVSKGLGSNAVEIYTVDALPDNVAGPSEVSGGWDHTAHPTDFASGQQENGEWGVGYNDEAIYWHPSFKYALGNNTDLATSDEGSPITMVVKFDEGTIIPADMKAYFNVFVLNDKGEKLNPETLEPQWDAAPVASGMMASDPDEVNLYYGSTGDKRYKTDGMILGVEFRFDYTSIIRYEGYSNTKLRSYAVTEDPGINTAIEGVVAEGNDADAPVEYYNLQGMKVANPQGGIFIRRQGNTVTKVLVK